MKKYSKTMGNSIVAVLVALLMLLSAACNDPEIKVVKVEIDRPVIDSIYVCPDQDKPLHFNSYNFDLDSGTASYELEFYRLCYPRSGTITITFSSTGGKGQPLEIVFYNGYTLVHTATFFLNGEDHEQVVTPPYFDSIRMKLSNGTDDRLTASIFYLEVI
jgi:hypothetical protein